MSARRLLIALAVCSFALPIPAASAHIVNVAGCPNENLVPTPANIAQVRAAALCLVNLERRAHGVGALITSSALQRVAQSWAGGIVARRFCTHGAWYTRLYNSGYRLPGRPYGFGEALGWDFQDRAAPRAMIMGRFLLTPLHHGWLIGPSFQHIGIGVVAASCQPSGASPGATYVFDLGRRS